jgi:transcriptional regulator
MTEPTAELLQGTLDLLILKILTRGPEHGWGVAQLIQQRSRDVLQVNQGSLYPALYRLEQHGLIRSEWRMTENNRRARYYSLTAAGVRQLAEERKNWRRMSEAVNLVMAVSRA